MQRNCFIIISSGNRDPSDAMTVSADADCTVRRKPMIETVVVIVDKRFGNEMIRLG